jgi:hypothetical protein
MLQQEDLPFALISFESKKKPCSFLLLRNQLELLDFHDHEDLCSGLGKVSKCSLSVMTPLLMKGCSNGVC